MPGLATCTLPSPLTWRMFTCGKTFCLMIAILPRLARPGPVDARWQQEGPEPLQRECKDPGPCAPPTGTPAQRTRGRPPRRCRGRVAQPISQPVGDPPTLSSHGKGPELLVEGYPGPVGFPTPCPARRPRPRMVMLARKSRGPSGLRLGEAVSSPSYKR
jgi:hypothetical protein